MNNFNQSFSFDYREREFESDSKFVVVTGAPMSGKTTAIKALNLPYEMEVARVYIERELANGRTKFEIRADEGEFQLSLLRAKLSLEARRKKDCLCIFDRGIPDTITYLRATELDPSPILKTCLHVRYAMVLHFDLIPLDDIASTIEKDEVRTEDPEKRLLLDEYLQRDYRALGYDIVKVPFMPLKERVSFIKSCLLRHGLVPPYP